MRTASLKKPVARRRRAPSLAALASLLVVVAFLGLPSRPASAAGADANTVEALLAEASAAYWMGIGEDGNPAALREGLARLAQARAHLAAAEATLPVSEFRRLRDAEAALRTDLRGQLTLAHDTLVGVFPLVRFAGPSLFRAPDSTLTFELLDDPEVVATVAATNNLLGSLVAGWATRPHQDVVVLSSPSRPDLEGEVRYVFGQDPRFFLHNESEIVSVAGPGPRVTLAPRSVHKLLESLQLQDVVVIHLVRHTPLYPRDSFYVMRADIWTRRELEPVHTSQSMGFARDRRSALAPLLLIHLGLLVATLILGLKGRQSPNGRRLEAVGVVLLAFFAGRALPWVTLPAVVAISPPPETLALSSFWVPPAMGMAALLVPVVVAALGLRRVSRAAPRTSKLLKPEKWGAAMGLGAGGWFATSALLWSGPMASVAAVLLAVSAGLVCAVVASAVCPWGRLKAAGSLPAVLLVALFGLAWATGSLAAAASMCVVAVLSYAFAEHASQAAPETDGLSRQDGGEPDPLGALVERLRAPPLVPVPALAQARTALEQAGDSEPRCLLVVGPEGSGKSRVAEALADELETGSAAVLRGRCPDEREQVPYSALVDLIEDKCSAGAIFGPSMTPLSAALDGLADSLFQMLPAAFQLPGESLSTALPGPNEIKAALCATLLELSGRRPLVLLLDDTQWLDPASADLLPHLVEQFKRPDLPQVILVLAGRPSPPVRALQALAGAQLIEIEQLDGPEIALQVATTAGLNANDAGRIARWTVDSHAIPTLGAALRVTEHLCRCDRFRETAGGLELDPALRGVEDLPVPPSIREEARQLLASENVERDLVGLAGCLGFEFEVGDLAQAMEQSRLQVVSALNDIERSSGAVRDVHERDGAFRFRDKLLLAAFQDVLDLRPREPGESCPQIVREYHARIARGLAVKSTLSGLDSLRVARHFRAAGREFAAESVPWQIKAIRVAAGLHQYELAWSLIERTRGLAELAGRVDELGDVELRVRCDEAHIRNIAELRRVAFGRIDRVLADQAAPEAWLLELAARTAYDAAEYERAIELGRQLQERGAGLRPSTRAAGLHFVGLSHGRLGQSPAAEEALREAVACLDGATSSDDRRHLGRILNSLATTLSWGDVEDQKEAHRLFEQSLLLKTEGRGIDRPGVARAHGGLARLKLVAMDPPDIDGGREHARANIAICRELSDRSGEAQMLSLLGRAARLSGELTEAREHYSAALALDPGHRMNAGFSAVGLLRCAIEEGDDAATRAEVGAVLSRIAQHGPLPRGPMQNLEEAVELAQSHDLEEAVALLLAVLAA